MHFLYWKVEDKKKEDLSQPPQKETVTRIGLDFAISDSS